MNLADVMRFTELGCFKFEEADEYDVESKVHISGFLFKPLYSSSQLCISTLKFSCRFAPFINLVSVTVTKKRKHTSLVSYHCLIRYSVVQGSVVGKKAMARAHFRQLLFRMIL